jgi:hypothetical protein
VGTAIRRFRLTLAIVLAHARVLWFGCLRTATVE